MPKHLDGIWANRSHQSRPINEPVVFKQKVSFTLPINALRRLAGKSRTLVFNVMPLARVAMAVTLAFGLIFGLMHPVFSQTFDLARMIKPGDYMVAFLNSAELRPSGGFLGSFAIAHYDGKTLDLEVETNIYKHDNEFIRKHRIALPKPLREVWPDRSLSLVNANYHADFKDSSELMLNFYEQEYGKKLDGVIGLTVLPVLDLVGLIGPIELPQDNLTLTQENFLHELHQNIQVDYFKNPENRLINEPKTVIANLVKIVPEKITALPKKTLWQLLEGALTKKQLMFYFNDNRQEIVELHNWAGRLTPTSKEYLAIYNGNYGGGKTSLGMEQDAKLEKISNQGRRLTITRTHPGGDDEFTHGENRNYMQIFLPKGSTLINMNRSGLPATQEVTTLDNQFTVFEFWFTTQPFSSTIVTLDYELPKSLESGMIIQKQPGVLNESILILGNDRVEFSGPLMYDLSLP